MYTLNNELNALAALAAKVDTETESINMKVSAGKIISDAEWKEYFLDTDDLHALEEENVLGSCGSTCKKHFNAEACRQRNEWLCK